MLMRARPGPGGPRRTLGSPGPVAGDRHRAQGPGPGPGPGGPSPGHGPGAEGRSGPQGSKLQNSLRRLHRMSTPGCTPMVRGPDPGDQGELLGARGPWPGPGPRAQARGPGALARGPAPGRRAGPALRVRSCKMPGINVDAGDAPMDGWCGARARGTKANFWGPGARGRARGPGPRPGARGPGARARGPAPGRRAGPAGPRLRVRSCMPCIKCRCRGVPMVRGPGLGDQRCNAVHLFDHSDGCGAVLCQPTKPTSHAVWGITNPTSHSVC